MVHYGLEDDEAVAGDEEVEGAEGVAGSSGAVVLLVYGPRLAAVKKTTGSRSKCRV